MSAEKTIVLVDDDSDFLEVNSYLLELSGYRVRAFDDPEAAFEAMRDDAPDLVISDVMMGELDSGFTLVRRLRETPGLAETPAILMTAASSQRGFDLAPRSPEDLDAMRVNAFLRKPVDSTALLAKIQEVLG